MVSHEPAPRVESKEADVIVVGAGPAGLASACVAAECGLRVVLIDDNPGRGGQIWRGEERAPKTGLARRWFARLAAAKVPSLTGWSVIGSGGPGVLVAERQGRSMSLTARAIVLATGARELFLPFPGWTHPQVIGAGGLQALAKAGLELKGRTVIVAGSGPLLLAVAHNLRQRGAHVPFIAEQADRGPILRFGLSLAAFPGKLAQAIALQAGLLGVPHRTTCWPVRAETDGSRLKVTFRRGKGTFIATGDYLACGWGLVPNLELPRLLGCEIVNGAVRIDAWQHTTQPGVFTAGETTGVAGLEAALAAGQIAGYAAAGQSEFARVHFAAREKARRFAEGLKRAFALRRELRELPEDSTLVCRCEDVAWGRLRLHGSSQAAKLQTRCGMGACQGRVCGAAMEFLLGWEPASVRPPIFPVTVSTLAHLAEGDCSEGSRSAD